MYAVMANGICYAKDLTLAEAEQWISNQEDDDKTDYGIYEYEG